MRQTLYDYCLENGREELIAEWDERKNLPLTLWEVAPNSHFSLWWHCGAGHSWRAQVRSRVNDGTGCPYCSGRKALSGFNDLAELRPDLALEWDGEKNAPLTPRQVTLGSGRNVWWKCPKGHAYRATIRHRTHERSGCPYCSGRRVLAGFNDLATTEPELAEEWDAALNAPLTPRQVTRGSKRQVWWRCRFGHVWRANVNSRTGRDRCGCPVCSGHYHRSSIDWQREEKERA